MTLASLLEVRLADGGVPPSGAASRLLVALDGGSTSDPVKRGRKHLLRALSEYLELEPTDSELLGVLNPLITAGFVEDCGKYEPAYVDVAPLFEGMNLPRVRKPAPYNSPADGEHCYRLTAKGHRVACVCLGVQNPLTAPPWFLGPDRVDDQVVLAVGKERAVTMLELRLGCCNTPDDQLLSSVARAIGAGLVEHADVRDGEARYRATLSGEVRQRALQKEVTTVAMRVAVPSVQQAIPAPLRLETHRKLDLLQELSEEQLCRHVIMPMLEGMGFLEVTYNNGPQERGKDIYCWRPDELGEHQWLAVLAKAGDVTGAASGNSSTLAITAQIRQLFFDPVVAPPAGRGVHMDRCWVIISGRFVGDALSKVENELRTVPLLRSVKWIEGTLLARLIDRHSPQVWVHLLDEANADVER